jgi:hypothetical protein
LDRRDPARIVAIAFALHRMATARTAMNRTRLFALAATSACTAWVLWLVLAEAARPSGSPHTASELARRPPNPHGPRAATADDVRQRPLGSSDSSRRAPKSRLAPPTHSHDAAWRQAYEQAARWKPDARSGDEACRASITATTCALMELPMRESWPRLESLALEGDQTAATALSDLTAQCVVHPQRRPHQAWSRCSREAPSRSTRVHTGCLRGGFEAQQRCAR